MSFLSNNALVNFDCQVQVPDFEGPLDLLLHLIKTHELDILNLPVSKITRQYLNYLDYMREMNLDLASEYLVMAATLTYLKSQVILPQEENNEATGQDPRAQLIKKLIELKNYKQLATDLAARPRLFRDVFPSKNTGSEELQDSFEPQVEVTNPFQLAEAYTQLLQRRKVHEHKVSADETPISSCVEHIVETLKTEERISFQKLLPTVAKPNQIISMFLGVLEMSRMQMTTIEQDNIFGPIFVNKREGVELERANAMIRGMSWE